MRADQPWLRPIEAFGSATLQKETRCVIVRVRDGPLDPASVAHYIVLSLQ
jgi:hypothetical protein